MKAGTVYSMRRGAEAPPPDAVRIDRATRWGNPVKITADRDRDLVLKEYKAWLWLRMQASPEFVSELVELAGRPLVCWCAPLGCHGDILAAAAIWAYESRTPSGNGKELA